MGGTVWIRFGPHLWSQRPGSAGPSAGFLPFLLRPGCSLGQRASPPRCTSQEPQAQATAQPVTAVPARVREARTSEPLGFQRRQVNPQTSSISVQPRGRSQVYGN